MSWENLIKRKKEPYTRETDAQFKRRMEIENNKVRTKMEVDRMKDSPYNLQMKNFQYEEMSRMLESLHQMFKYFKEVYEKQFPQSGPKHIQTLDKALLKVNELFELVTTLPSLYTKDDELEEGFFYD